MNGKMQECQKYFQERPVWDKVFRGFRRKYEGLGRFGGRITLTGLSLEEKKILGGFFQKDYTGNKTVTISAELMEKALNFSRFGELTWEEILEEYFGEKLLANKEREKLAFEERMRFFQDILAAHQQKYGTQGQAIFWLRSVLEEDGKGRTLMLQHYRENRISLRESLLIVMDSIEKLPCFKRDIDRKLAGMAGKKHKICRELLPVFAARTTGDPHYYDMGSSGEKLLTSFLEYYFQTERKGEIWGAWWHSSLYYQAGILKDDLSNDVLVYGIQARKNNGQLHQGVEGFYREKQPMRLTLQTVGNLQSAWPMGIEEPPEMTEKYPVYVVENPAVFSSIIRKNPFVSALCSSGQPCLAVLALLDLLAEKSLLYYAGDFDPDGLLILQRLKNRYGEKLIPWGYQVKWYEKYRSETELSEPVLKKLDKVTLPQVQDIKESMKKYKNPAYQEAMLRELVGAI